MMVIIVIAILTHFHPKTEVELYVTDNNTRKGSFSSPEVFFKEHSSHNHL